MTLHDTIDAVANEAPTTSHAADQVPHDLFIAGQWQPADGGTMSVVNPAT
jgi:hypothetical protein